ncbi:histidine kinase [Oscillospiraceae bacterium MB08-C2-2]|nr:histidine kinase [Oscillospiraceae bacterium MB08-C2-2]
MTYRRSVQNWWLSLSIRYKIGIFIGIIVVMVVTICLFALGAVYIHTQDFNEILGDSYQVNYSLVCFEAENSAFITCSRNKTEDNFAQYYAAKKQTQAAISTLKLDYQKTGVQRYLLTQAVQTAYVYYSGKCEQLLQVALKDTAYANQYYNTLDAAGYINSYLQDLMKETLDEGTNNYARKMQSLQLLPVITISFAVVILILAALLGAMVMRQIIRPVLKMANNAQQIADNQLDIPDIHVKNQDEIGQLVNLFNKMKGSMREYIAALQEVIKMEVRLHQKALQEMEMEKQLKSMQLSMLQSQINPHFLFNTLNTICSTAKIEEARYTEELIQKLANLFRYNLQASDAIVPLEREINIILDYMYIQQRRFGSRLTFFMDSKVDEKAVFIPVFTLQPLVENAIIHGISPKEEGGSVRVRIRRKGEYSHITITDTGMGISRQALQKLLEETAAYKGHLSHIGMGNVRSRLELLFADSSFRVHSRIGLGTSVRLVLPVHKEGEAYV